MSNRKHTLTFNLEFDEDFNREVNELIKAKTMESIRANCQSVIDQAVRDTIPKIIEDRIMQIKHYNITAAVQEAVREYLKSPEGKRQINESTIIRLGNIMSLDTSVDSSIREWVNHKLSRIVPEDIISAVAKSIVESIDR